MKILHTDMREINLRKLDLNLLVALDALLTAEEVSAAADKMCITQSAMSHTLNRLREQFGDPLLIKGKGRMIKTPRAEALTLPLRKALLELQHAIQTDVDFVPATSRLRFNIATNDYGDLILLPQLLAMLNAEAPHIDVRVSHYDPANSITPLESGLVDLALCLPIRQAPNIHQETLFDDGFCCVSRRDHAALKKGLDLDRFVSLPHLLLAPRGEQRDMVDRQLARLGRSRRIALSTPNLNSAPMIVARSELLLAHRAAPLRQRLAGHHAHPHPRAAARIAGFFHCHDLA